MKLKTKEDLCSGCGVCRVVCSLQNMNKIQPSLALLKVTGRFPSPGKYKIAYCNQCGICADSCPEEAIMDNDGVYVIDYERCTGCLVCMDSCPEGVIVVTADGLPVKCNGCGKCVELCPRNALMAL